VKASLKKKSEELVLIFHAIGRRVPLGVREGPHRKANEPLVETKTQKRGVKGKRGGRNRRVGPSKDGPGLRSGKTVAKEMRGQFAMDGLRERGRGIKKTKEWCLSGGSCWVPPPQTKKGVPGKGDSKGFENVGKKRTVPPMGSLGSPRPGAGCRSVSHKKKRVGELGNRERHLKRYLYSPFLSTELRDPREGPSPQTKETAGRGQFNAIQRMKKTVKEVYGPKEISLSQGGRKRRRFS